MKRLQDENRKLSNSLVAANERDSAFSEDGKCNDIVICISTTVTLKFADWNLKFVTYSFLETYFEIELVKKLEIKIEKQRNEIKKLEQSTIDYKTENEEVSNISRNFTW